MNPSQKTLVPLYNPYARLYYIVLDAFQYINMDPDLKAALGRLPFVVVLNCNENLALRNFPPSFV